jgi:hypothetical protein
MANGQQVAEENVQLFSVWAKSKTDDDFRNMAIRGVLSRQDIAAECGFSKSALTQNPRIKRALKELEDSLRERNVLPPLATNDQKDAVLATPVRQPDSSRQARDAERLSHLERAYAAVKAENEELKRQLARFTVLQEALAETGRLPR